MARPRKVSPEMAAEMQVFYDGCKSIKKTAEQFGVSRHIVSTYIEHKGTKKIDEETRDYVCELYREFGDYRTVAKIMRWGNPKTLNVLNQRQAI